MKHFKIILLLNLITLPLLAQEGKYYLTHYSPSSEQITNDNFSIIQDSKQQMLFANSKGVLKFDGRFWQLVNTPSTALSISNYKNEDENYVGCIDDIGFIEIDKSGSEVYKSIASFKTKPPYFNKLVSNANYVYFLSQEILVQYNKSTKKITGNWEASKGYEFTQLFNIGENIFVFDENKGFFRFEEGKLSHLKTEFAPLGNLSFACNADQNRALLCTNEGKMFFFNGVYIKEIGLDDALYIKNSIPIDAVLLKDDLMAIATSKGGVVLVNPVNGKNVSTINFYSGLPDDEVYTIGKDNQSGLWIAHEYGFSRLDYFLPFKNFSVYPGLEGKITSSLSYQNKLYVGTNEGLFYLDKVTDVEKLNEILKKRKKPAVKDEDQNRSEPKQNLFNSIRNIFGKKKNKKIEEKKAELEAQAKTKESAPEPKKEKGFLGGLFKKKKKIDKEDKPAIKEKETTAKVLPKPKRKPKTAAKLNEVKINTSSIELQSINFAFQKIKGIEGKVRHLLLLNRKLLVVTNNGLYEVAGESVKKICPEAISYLFITKDLGNMYLATDNRGIIAYKIESNGYSRSAELTGFKEKLSGIAADNLNNLWLSFDNFLIKYKNSDFNIADTISIENPFSEEINLMLKDNKMHFLLNSKSYYFEEKNKKLVADSTYINANNDFLKIIHSEPGILWYQSGNEWKLIAEDKTNNPNFIYLSLIKDISQIYIDENKKYLWITSKTNNLYRFDISNKAEVKFAQNIFLKSLSDKRGKLLDIKQIELNEESGNVSFSFINPEYIDNESLQFQYKLSGLSENWSAWSRENKINFSYLPSGKYELFVRTKNSINQVRESTPLVFKVRPPYWKEWWFYLGELLFFGSLLIGSILVNNATHQKNEWLSKGLTFLTIVMMIEFINTVFESYLKFQDSPVFSFLVQVFLAILILPFERILSKFITQDSKNTIAAVTRSRKSSKDPKNVDNQKSDSNESL